MDNDTSRSQLIYFDTTTTTTATNIVASTVSVQPVQSNDSIRLFFGL